MWGVCITVQPVCRFAGVDRPNMKISEAVNCASKFLLWTCGYGGQDPVLAAFTKLALELCNLEHSIFKAQTFSMNDIQTAFDSLTAGIIGKLVEPSRRFLNSQVCIIGIITPHNDESFSIYVNLILC